MKKLTKRISAVIFSVLFPLMAFPLYAAGLANSGSAQFNGFYDTPVWELQTTVYRTGTGEELNDLFGEITRDLAPGCERSFTVKLSNQSAKAVNVYLRAAPVTHDPGDSLDGLTSDKLTELTGPGGVRIKNDVYQVLEWVHLTIVNPLVSVSSPPLYDGSLYGNGAGVYSAGGTLLGQLDVRDDRYITVTVSVPASLGNEVKDAVAAVQWQFIAEEVPTKSSTPPPATSPPVETLPPTEPPAEPPEDIPEEIVPGEPPPLEPPSDYEVVITPKTGDDQSYYAWVILSAVSLLCLIALLIYSIRRERNNRMTQ